jgi:Methyltransferase domain
VASQIETDSTALESAFSPDCFVSASLTRPQGMPQNPDEMPDLHKVDFKPVLIKNQQKIQVTYAQKNRVLHRNLTLSEALAEFNRLLATRFTHGVVHTPDGHVAMRRKAAIIQYTQVTERNAAPIALQHNRVRNRLLPEGKPIDFLIRLGVMTADGRVVASKFDKFRQINRFLEMVEDVWPDLEKAAAEKGGALRVIDFGSGKSYLTFALHHYLTSLKGVGVQITGLDLKRDVIQECSEIARDLGCSGLDFQVGDIASYQSERADLVVSLHACDTATDYALKQAVQWQASVILAVPCCQHELFQQIASAQNQPILKHGILKERLSALITDAVRAEWLENCGYRVQVMEFIETAHTPKNLLIRAVRSPAKRPGSTARLEQFCEGWSIKPLILAD